MREYTIVNILYTRKSPVRMSELIAEVGLSERTLRDVIRALDKTGEANGFGIRMIRSRVIYWRLVMKPNSVATRKKECCSWIRWI